MAIVLLQLPVVKRKSEIRPQKCPHYRGEPFQRWGKVRKPVRDSRYRSVQVYRYLCCHCRQTFSHYPQGVDRADQTQRLRKLEAIFWVLGMSLRGVVTALSAFGVQLSHMTVWRDLQEQADLLEKRRHWKPVGVLGLDGAYVRAWGNVRSVLVAVDLGEGKPVAIGYVDEYNSQAVRRWLEPLVKRLGVSVIVTDDLVHYKTVAQKLDLEHQIRQFHVRRWVGRTLKELRESVPKDWLWVIDEVKLLITDLPLAGSRRLFELWKQIPERRAGRDQHLSALDQLRPRNSGMHLLLIRLSEHGPNFRIFNWQTDVPWTNNGSEQVIGRMKMRSRTVRGYKSQQVMLNALMLAGTSVC